MLADVLLLSRITGAQVVAADGEVVGRLADLTVRLDGGDGPHLVERLLVSRHGAPPVLLSWDAVTNVHRGRPVLAVGAHGVPDDDLYDDEIRLARDVLDTQVVDLAGQRLARVADVVLARTPESRLEICGVEVGFGGVLRRLGLGRLVPRPTEDVVAWPDLHLTSERGHAVQLTAPRAPVHRRARGRQLHRVAPAPGCPGQPGRHRLGYRDPRSQGAEPGRRSGGRDIAGGGGAGAAGDAGGAVRADRRRDVP